MQPERTAGRECADPPAFRNRVLGCGAGVLAGLCSLLPLRPRRTDCRAEVQSAPHLDTQGRHRGGRCAVLHLSGPNAGRYTSCWDTALRRSMTPRKGWLPFATVWRCSGRVIVSAFGHRTGGNPPISKRKWPPGDMCMTSSTIRSFRSTATGLGQAPRGSEMSRSLTILKPGLETTVQELPAASAIWNRAFPYRAPSIRGRSGRPIFWSAIPAIRPRWSASFLGRPAFRLRLRHRHLWRRHAPPG